MLMNRLILLLSSLMFLFSCGGGSSDDNVPPQSNDDFDRTVLLANIYDNIAMIAFDEFQSKLESLNESTNEYVENPSDISLLNNLREDWFQSYVAWQHIEVFSHFGEGEEILYGFKMNTYPTDVNRTQNILNGIAQFNSAYNDNQGFPALEYLLYGVGDSDEQIISVLSEPNASALLVSMVSEMISNTSSVYTWWTENRTTIVEDNNSTATSSLNLLINDFVYHYEKGFRTNKFGIPCGYFSGGQTFADKTEGYYAKNISKILALNSLYSISNVFEGKSHNDNSVIGESIYSYLNYLQEGTLADEILIKIDEIEVVIGNLEDDFASQVNSNNDELLNTFNLIQSVVAKFKIDMMMAMGVGVDYISGDGD